MSRYGTCCVLNCPNSSIHSRTGTPIRFHLLPNIERKTLTSEEKIKEKERLSKWLINIKRTDLLGTNMKQRVCSVHFEARAYSCPSNLSSSGLLPSAIPTLVTCTNRPSLITPRRPASKKRHPSKCPSEPLEERAEPVQKKKKKLRTKEQLVKVQEKIKQCQSQMKAKLLGVQNDCKSEIDGWIATDNITGFTLFCDEAKHYLGGNKWTYELDETKEGQECIRFILLPDLSTLEKNRCIFTITVFFDMTVKLFSKSTGDIPDSSLSWIFGNEDEPPVLEYWSQFVTLVSQCSTGVWVDGNDDIQRVYIINDLHQLFPDVEDEAMLSSNTASSNSEEKNTESIGDNFGKDDRRLQILGLTQELYRVIFQRNQLIKKMQHLQELAIIDVDVFSLILGVDVNPEGKTELDKVSKLVQTITNDLEIGGDLNVLLPLLVKQYWSLMDDDNPFQNKPPYIPNNSSLPKDKSEIRVDDITGEMNGDSNCGVIKDDNISDQSLVVNTLQAEEQENQVDEDLDENSNNDSHLSNSKIEDDSSLKTIVFKNYGKRVSSYSLRQQIWTKHNQEQENQVDEVKDLDENIKDPHLLETNTNDDNNLKTKPFDQYYFCQLCGNWIRSDSLNEHTWTKHKQEIPPELLVNCNICGKEFFKSSSLCRHMQLMHKKIFPNECSICGKHFKNQSLLKEHFKMHHIEHKGFQCSVCGRTFKWDSTFKRHCITAHTEEKPFKCSICNKGFKTIYYLKIHEKHVHQKRKNKFGRKKRDDEWSGLFEFKKGEDQYYYCIVCNKSFPLWSGLKKHMRRHSDKKAYKCDICGISVKDLKSHIKRVHSEGLTVYQCSLCPKKFKSKQNLKQHQIVHTERELLKCTLCDKTFKGLKSLQNHQKHQKH